MALTSLLVCADAQAVQVLTRILREMGSEVEHWGDPAEAAARLSMQQFDALLVDCTDEQAAMGLIAHARKTENNNKTVAILLVDGQNNVRDVFSQGANFVLYKPISAERVNSSLKAGIVRRNKSRKISRLYCDPDPVSTHLSLPPPPPLV
jgi:DNA-binding response OmpR family regulator